jgi:perosamine synthetase
MSAPVLLNLNLPDLREPGAPVAPGNIPLCVPFLGGREREYLQECLDTNMVSSVGGFVKRFEQELAAFVGASHAVALVNGTSALHLALMLAGVQRDDEVVTSTLSFIAPANAIRYLDAWPVFIDADAQYWQLDTQKVADFLASQCIREGDGELRNKGTGRRIAAILPVHILGHPVDLDPLLSLAAQYDLPVVEDATESLGARYRGTMTGTRGLAGCFSFNGNKLITTGGGGMLVTDDAAVAARAKYLSTQAKDNPIEFVHGAVGFNYRLTNIAAALGCAQLENIGTYIDAKRQIARRYEQALHALPGIQVMREAEWATSVSWMYTVLIDSEVTGVSSREVLEQLDAQGIQTRPLWQPLHQSPAHAGAFKTHCPVAERLAQQALSLPCSVNLTTQDQDRVIDAIYAILGHVRNT